MTSRSFFVDENGFTTTSMVLALLITLSLVFMSAQVYRINTTAAQVQDVADAAVLAAENQVADFVLACRLCDAVILSLSLAGLTMYGVGAVALCVPATAGIGDGLLDAADKTLKARDAFAEDAADALNRLQDLLPYLAAVRAASVAAANNESSNGSNYIAAAILVPLEGKDVAVDLSKEAEERLSDLNDQSQELKQKAQELEDASKEASLAKERAFARDCGDAPGYCMYERAESLAGLNAAKNPLYTSVDAWSFSVSLERARAYYAARLDNELPDDGSVSEQARSALRRNFYKYACEKLAGAYVIESDDAFEANFPHLPRNTQEMKATPLYTDAIYPITHSEDGDATMHAWSGCPNASGADAVGSLSQLDEGEWDECPLCSFSVSSMGNVAAASTSIDNGFEYHYEAVAKEAESYERARKKADPLARELKDKTSSAFDSISQAIAMAAAKRIDPSPPGGSGAIAIVVNVSETSARQGFENSFVHTDAALGARAAIAGATLLPENSEEGKTAINSILDGFADQGVGVEAAGIALDCWSGALVGYERGVDGFIDSVRNTLDAIPLASASGIGKWASNRLSGAISAVGLQPAEVESLKPVLLNTMYVASSSDEEAATNFISIKKFVLSNPMSSTDPFESLIEGSESYVQGRVEDVGDSIEIAQIDLFGGGNSIPVTIPIPEEAKAYTTSVIGRLFDDIRNARAQFSEVRLWE